MANEVKGALEVIPHVYELKERRDEVKLVLSEKDVCAVMLLLVQISPGTNVFLRFPASVADQYDEELRSFVCEYSENPSEPARANPDLVQFFSAPGNTIALRANGGVVLSNNSILARVREFLLHPTHHSRLVVGQYATAFHLQPRAPFGDREDPANRDPLGVIVRQFHDALRLEKIHYAVRQIAPLGGCLPRTAQPFELEHGYAFMHLADPRHDGLFVMQWLDLAKKGILHLDLQPSSLLNSGLIDYDNAILQLAGKSEWVSSNAGYNPRESALVGDIKQLLRLTGSKAPFFVSGQYSDCWLISPENVDMDRFGTINRNPVQVLKIMDTFEQVRTGECTLSYIRFTRAGRHQPPSDDPHDPIPFKIPFHLDPIAQQAAESDALWQAMHQ